MGLGIGLDYGFVGINLTTSPSYFIIKICDTPDLSLPITLNEYIPYDNAVRSISLEPDTIMI
jgi:hypothetical protein